MLSTVLYVKTKNPNELWEEACRTTFSKSQLFVDYVKQKADAELLTTPHIKQNCCQGIGNRAPALGTKDTYAFCFFQLPITGFHNESIDIINTFKKETIDFTVSFNAKRSLKAMIPMEKITGKQMLFIWGLLRSMAMSEGDRCLTSYYIDIMNREEGITDKWKAIVAAHNLMFQHSVYKYNTNITLFSCTVAPGTLKEMWAHCKSGKGRDYYRHTFNELVRAPYKVYILLYADYLRGKITLDDLVYPSQAWVAKAQLDMGLDKVRIVSKEPPKTTYGTATIAMVTKGELGTICFPDTCGSWCLGGCNARRVEGVNKYSERKAENAPVPMSKALEKDKKAQQSKYSFFTTQHSEIKGRLGFIRVSRSELAKSPGFSFMKDFNENS